MFDSALAQWQLWCDSEPELVRQLKGGLTNASYLIRAQDKEWVLRINAKNSADLDLNRQLESQILSLQGIDRLAPRLVYCDPGSNFMVMEYLPGKVWQSDAVHSQKDIADLAKLLKAIHQLATVDGVLDCRQKAMNYWRHIDNSSPIARAIKKLQPTMAWHFDQASAQCEIVYLCHNDLLADNLICADDGGLYAIDWEYAAMGDPYFDLAVIVEGHGLDAVQSQALLAAYIGDVAVEACINAQQRLFHSRVIYCYLALLWYVLQSESHGAMDAICEEKLAALKVLLSKSV